MTQKSLNQQIPNEVAAVLETLRQAGHEAYIVGGCVRDLLLSRTPKDWDITTSAKPEEVQSFFPDSFYENKFGTVGVKTDAEDPALSLIEVTTFRKEGKYTDKRHPDEITFAETLEEDLARRDFTVNAIAFNGTEVVDPLDGTADLEQKLIRTVGDPAQRFQEDALRLMRGVRFATELEFTVAKQTSEAIKKHAGLLKMIAKERMRDELRAMIMTPRGDQGIIMLQAYGLLRHILPELEEGIGVTQNKHHIYTVWEHNIRALRYACEQGYSFQVRMASLLHDVGKPRVKRGEGVDATFYGHEVVGARMAVKALQRLRFSKEDIEKIGLLVRSHMFSYDPEVVTDAAVRRLVTKVGPENIKELVQVREADRIGSGVPKAVPYRLRHFLFRVEKVLTDFISRKELQVDGNILMDELGLEPGPRLGAVLDALFEEVLDDPSRNTREALLARARELATLSDEELAQMRRQAQEKYQEVLEEQEEEIKKKYRVR